jgi:hypothetical protein
VRSVGLRLLLDHGTVQQSRSLELSSGGVMRGALASALATDPVTPTCPPGGTGKALLSLNVAGGAGTEGLKLSGSNAISAGATKVLVDVTAGTTTTFALTVTDALGLQTLLTKQVTC